MAGCTVDSCERDHYLQGLCRSHYRRKLRAGTTDGLRESAAGKTCTVDCCDDGQYCKTYCRFHYGRWRKRGTTDDPPARPCKPKAPRVREYPKVSSCQDCGTSYEQRACNQVRCNACQRESECAASRAYYEKNSERVKARSSAYYWANVDTLREWHREHGRRESERRREYYAEYRRKHPERRAFHEQRRQARKRTDREMFPFTREQLDQRMSMFGYTCWICGGEYEQVDHVKPLARGGHHALANLRPSCGRCNRAKGAKWPFDTPSLFDAA